METRRIGTDIKLYVSLKDNVNQPLNIHSVQAFLVNTSLKDKLKQQIKDAYDAYDNASSDKSIKYISRFPNEPMCDCYRSTRYDICQSGYPTYHAAPYYIKPFYRGFGVYPHTFDAFRNHAWAHRCVDKEMFDIVKAEKEYKDKSSYIQYQAVVEESNKPGVIHVYFPAKDQIECGKYSLILVVKCYAPGYTTQTLLKTITFDYKDVLELVSDMDLADNDSVVEVGIIEPDINITGDDTYVNKGRVESSSNQDNLILGLSTGGEVPIDFSRLTAWYTGD